MGTEERHLQISRGGMGDVHEALAWVVQRLDADFDGATMVKLVIDQHMVCGQDPTTGGPDEQWVYQWSAMVSGCLTHKEHPDPPGGFTSAQRPDS